MMVIFLVGLVSMILMRTLRRDYARYTARDDDDLESLERDMNEESGWKLVRAGQGWVVRGWLASGWHWVEPRGWQGLEAACRSVLTRCRNFPTRAPSRPQVHGDVFRPPRNLELLAALIGTGMQLALLVLSVILITIAGTLFVERGTIVTVFIIVYALTSFVGG